MLAMPTFNAIRSAIKAGNLIAKGVLNNTYRIEISQEIYFVRERILNTSTDYGQSFAGERYIPKSLKKIIPIPSLLGVVSDATERERYAIFDYIPSIETKWSSETLGTLVNYFLSIHGYSRKWPGKPRDSREKYEINEYIKKIFSNEIIRLSESDRAINGIGRRIAKIANLLPRYKDDDICLCHGDVRHANFLTGRDGKLWLIDWEAIRYRVPASDFNQLTHDWLTEEEDIELIIKYCKLRNIVFSVFLLEVLAYRVLWHLRTYNFEVNIRGGKKSDFDYHLGRAKEILNKVEL